MVWDLLVTQVLLSEFQGHSRDSNFCHCITVSLLPEVTETLLITVKVSQVFISKPIQDSLQASSRVMTGEKCSPFSFKDIPRTLHWPLCPEWWKAISGRAAVFLTTCSQMLSMNDSGKGKRHRILVPRKGEVCSLLNMSVRWNRLSKVVLKVTLSRRGPGSKSQDLWLHVSIWAEQYKQASSLRRASVPNLWSGKINAPGR